ncbi:MAG: TonB-dependent receptor [Proteobacteria bacterium]|nr:MAG: TonB-dependent receptor [Pseudomonadota bacterium]
MRDITSRRISLALLAGLVLSAQPVLAQDAAVPGPTPTPATEPSDSTTPPADDAQTKQVPTGEVVPQNQNPNPIPTGPTPPTPGTGSEVSVQKETNAPSKSQPEQIIVTGSRIKRIDAENSTPTKVLRQEDFNKAGVTTVVELLQNQTENSFGSFMGGGGYVAVGQSTFSLHGLGADRTLILVNGRRLPREASLGGTNINNIPLAMVDRVEILKSSAAAVYGADAIAGVVNVILKKSVTGSEVSAKHNQSYEKGGNTTKIDAVTGFKVLNTDVTLAVGAGHTQQILTKNRKKLWQEASPYDLSTAGAPTNTYSWGLQNPNNPAASLGDYVYRASPNCPPEMLSAFPNDPTTVLCRGDGRKVSSSELMPRKDERFATINLENQFGDVAVSTTIMATQTLTESMPSSRTLTSNPARTGAYVLPFSQTPADLQAQAASLGLNYTPDQLIKISAPRYFPEIKGTTQSEDTSIGAMIALTGPITSTWDWNFDASHFVTKRVVDYDKAPDRLAFVQNLFPVSRTEAPSFNIFTDDLSAIGSYFIDLHREETNVITSATAYASGPVFELPGGTAQVAAGLSASHEKYTLSPDLRDREFLNTSPETAGIFRARYLGSFGAEGQGKRDVTSAFAEVNLPVLKEIDVGFTGRWDHYSDFGDTVNYGTSLVIKPVSWLKVRGNAGSGFRAPSLSEIFNSADGGYLSVTDPRYCDNTVPADNPCGNNGTGYSVFVNSPGNPDLKEETSFAWTTGFLVEPSEVYNISVDYWNTRVNDTVGQESLRRLIEKEIAGQSIGNSVISRGEDGRIGRIDNSFGNLGRLKGAGYDIGSNLKLRAGELDYGLTTQYSRTLSSKSRPTAEDPEEEYVGSFGAPRYRLTNSIFLGNKVHSGSFDIFTTGKQESGRFRTDPTYGYISPENRYDISYGWKYMDGGTLSLGVYNIENRMMGLYVADKETRGVSYDRTVADLRGRQFQIGLKQAF